MVIVICVLVALSPGPSLALVVRNTMLGGHKPRLATALSHGFGVGLYAAIAVTGIGLVIVQSTLVFQIIQYTGAAFLLYLAFNALKSNGSNIDLDVETDQKNKRINGWRDGFLLAFLNPKLAYILFSLI